MKSKSAVISNSFSYYRVYLTSRRKEWKKKRNEEEGRPREGVVALYFQETYSPTRNGTTVESRVRAIYEEIYEVQNERERGSFSRAYAR